MKVFDTYASYYDLLYKDKDYESEANYIIQIINRYKPEAKKILNLGCGTGRHDFIFADKGYDVTGIDMSGRMIAAANENLNSKEKFLSHLRFIEGDIRNTELNEKFDVVFALFHVMSYQSKNDDVKKTFATVKNHLNPGGLFIFDFWYGPAVLTERPEFRIKKMENESVTVERYAEPDLLINENIVDVRYKVQIREKQTGKLNEINETHSMRYFFLPEINLLLDEFELKPLHFEEWLTSDGLSEKTWSALAVAVNN